MTNPYKPGDKVLIQRNAVNLEATVRRTWNHEVQVRVADGELLWRTVKTVTPVTEPESVTAAEAEEGGEIGELNPPEALKGAAFDEPPVPELPVGNDELQRDREATDNSLPELPEEAVVSPEGAVATPPVEAVAPKGRKRRKGVLGRIFSNDFDQ